jgi:hypothetical protein
MSNHTIGTFLKNHPRLLGVLFATAVLSSQFGAAAASAVHFHGP